MINGLGGLKVIIIIIIVIVSDQKKAVVGSIRRNLSLTSG